MITSGRAAAIAASIDSGVVMSTSGKSAPVAPGSRVSSARPSCPLCPVMKTRMVWSREVGQGFPGVNERNYSRAGRRTTVPEAKRSGMLRPSKIGVEALDAPGQPVGAKLLQPRGRDAREHAALHLGGRVDDGGEGVRVRAHALGEDLHGARGGPVSELVGDKVAPAPQVDVVHKRQPIIGLGGAQVNPDRG